MLYLAGQERREHAAALAITFNGTRGDPDSVKKIVKEGQE